MCLYVQSEGMAAPTCGIGISRGMEAEEENAKAAKARINELVSRSECFEKAGIGTRHLIRGLLQDYPDM